ILFVSLSLACGMGNAKPSDDFAKSCLETLSKTVRPASLGRLAKYCERLDRLPVCSSVEGRPITHSDFISTDPRGKKVLVFGLIHGDEPLAGEMALDWAERLHDLREKKIEPRNSWRVVPLLNPDGLEKKTRMNANGVDLNRNFPTKDWSEDALAFWKKKTESDPRRFPGDTAASEAETKCAIAHIKDFKPDFILSVHTPYHVLDFDGPKMPFPAYKDLPWRALGNFPGSLGRYMWRDYQIPVLTVELGETMVDSAALQDIVGTFAIEAARRSGQKTASLYELM
ncbi:MAG: M14 family zinc carboxypeptidase, partial [Bdellovibrionota bacterium]